MEHKMTPLFIYETIGPQVLQRGLDLDCLTFWVDQFFDKFLIWWRNWEVVRLRVEPFWRKPQRGVFLKDKANSSSFPSLVLLLAYCKRSDWAPSLFGFYPTTCPNAKEPADRGPKSLKPIKMHLSSFVFLWHFATPVEHSLSYYSDGKGRCPEFITSSSMRGLPNPNMWIKNLWYVWCRDTFFLCDKQRVFSFSKTYPLPGSPVVVLVTERVYQEFTNCVPRWRPSHFFPYLDGNQDTLVTPW